MPRRIACKGFGHSGLFGSVGFRVLGSVRRGFSCFGVGALAESCIRLTSPEGSCSCLCFELLYVDPAGRTILSLSRSLRKLLLEPAVAW